MHKCVLWQCVCVRECVRVCERVYSYLSLSFSSRCVGHLGPFVYSSIYLSIYRGLIPLSPPSCSPLVPHPRMRWHSRSRSRSVRGIPQSATRQPCFHSHFIPFHFISFHSLTSLCCALHIWIPCSIVKGSLVLLIYVFLLLLKYCFISVLFLLRVSLFVVLYETYLCLMWNLFYFYEFFVIHLRLLIFFGW